MEGWLKFREPGMSRYLLPSEEPKSTMPKALHSWNGIGRFGRWYWGNGPDEPGVLKWESELFEHALDYLRLDLGHEPSI